MATARISGRIQRVLFAVNGLCFVLRNEVNARLHLGAAVVIVGVAIALGLNSSDWRWILAAIAWVWSAEVVNTAIERLCDVVCPHPNAGIRVAKDVAAGSVLVSALGAAAIGAITLAPYLASVLAAGSFGPLSRTFGP